MNLSECIKYDIACYALSYEVMGGLAWIGFIVTIIGLWIAIYQIFKIKKSSIQVNGALDRLNTHIDGVNLAYLSAQMNIVTHLVQSKDCHLAQITFTPLKRTIRLHANSKNLDQEGVDALNRTIGKIDKQIEWGKTDHDKFSQVAANKHMDDLLSQLTIWESSASDRNRKELQIENA